MPLRALLLNVVLGVVFVMVWGVVTYVGSDATEFKPYFFGGLANFVFYIAGAIAIYLTQFVEPRTSGPGSGTERPQGRAFDVSAASQVALATIMAVALTNFLQEGFTSSLESLSRSRAISMTPDGYRDLQMYAGGAFSMASSAAVMAFCLFVGSSRPGTTYLTVLTGVLVSMGLLALTYIVYGIFFGFQFSMIFSVTGPPAFSGYGPVVKRFVGIATTSFLVVVVVLTWTTILWCCTASGGLRSGQRPLRLRKAGPPTGRSSEPY